MHTTTFTTYLCFLPQIRAALLAFSLLACTGLWAAQGEEAQRKRQQALDEERRQVSSVQNLLAFLTMNKPVSLAQVVRVDQQPEGGYRKAIGVLGGRLRVLEHLSGPPSPAWIEIDNRHFPEPTGVSYRPPRTIMQMHLKQYWIIVYDPKGRDNEFIAEGSYPLKGLDDPLLALYRRHISWLKKRDFRQVVPAMREALLNQQTSLASRIGALCSLFTGITLRGDDYASNPYYPLARRILVDLLAQPKLPFKLHLAALQCIHIDPRKGEIQAGSEDARLLRYLLDVVKNEPDASLVDQAAEKLGYFTSQSDSKPPYTAYYFPEIVKALEKRQELDTANSPYVNDGFHAPGPRRSGVSRALVNLTLSGRRSLKDIQGVPVVIRHIPPKP